MPARAHHSRGQGGEFSTFAQQWPQDGLCAYPAPMGDGTVVLAPPRTERPPAMAAHRRQALAAVSGQTVIAAFTFLIAKGTLDAVEPLALAMLRMAGAALLLGLAMGIPRDARPRRLDRAVLRELAWLGVIGVTVNQSCFLAGLARSTPTHAALLYALTPAFVHLIAIHTRDERPNALFGLGIGLALAGALVVIAVRSPTATPSPDTTATVRGDLLILAGVLAWAIYSARAPRHVRTIGALRFTGVTAVAGGLAAIPIGLPAMIALTPRTVPLAAWGGLAYLIVFTSGIAYLLWTLAMKGLSATQVAVFANLQPVLTALLSAALLGERLSLALVVGGGLVLAGVALTQWSMNRMNRHGLT
jgi:drug/metabolite transporter (DMT)-like permease